MEFIPLSLFAGILTIFSPCVLPLLPVIVGGSLTNKNKWRPLIITTSLAISLVAFGILLKSTTLLIDVPRSFWTLISGGIILIFGILTIYPHLWETISTKFNLSTGSQSLLQKSAQSESHWSSVLIGLSLGPVFSSCSPTYALVVASILPESFMVGLINLIVYALGLSGTLLVIAVFGQRIINKTKWAADPSGLFRKILGLVFVLVGLAIILGLDKEMEAYLIQNGFLGTTQIEYNLFSEQLNR